MNMENYNVAIIGAGPAGLFAANYILKHSENITVALIDKGKSADDRKCCKDCCICPEKNHCNILCGVGGSGLFSDGKLVLDLHSGGNLDAITTLSDEKRHILRDSIVSTLREHDGKSEPGPVFSDSKQKFWQQKFEEQELHIKHYDVLHMGTENLHHITSAFASEVYCDARVTLKLNCEITNVENGQNGASVIRTKEGELFSADYVVFAVGKTGSDWLKQVFTNNEIKFDKTDTYIGIRLEVPQDSLKELFDYSFDPKIWRYSHGRKIKTHCFCRRGDIICTNYMGFPVVGGHTRYTADNNVPAADQSHKGNFNILASTHATENEIICVLRKFREINPGGIVVQSLFNYLNPKAKGIMLPRVQHANEKEGDIRGIWDSLDYTGTAIADFIKRLSDVIPGILSHDSLVYGPALEWFMDSVEVDTNMETSHRGWFAVGDGAGLSQGIVHSAATSIIAAEEICRRLI